MHNIYILLTYTGTIFSRLIKCFTRRKYTHASIALDGSCRHLYSFARKQVFPPFPAGFVRENLNEGIFAINYNCRCAMYRLEVDEKTYEKIANQLFFMNRYDHVFQYNFLGAIYSFFHIPYHHEQKYFCSEFVADILQRNGAIIFEKPAALFHPSDFAHLPEMELIYEGTLKGMQSFFDETDSVIDTEYSNLIDGHRNVNHDAGISWTEGINTSVCPKAAVNINTLINGVNDADPAEERRPEQARRAHAGTPGVNHANINAERQPAPSERPGLDRSYITSEISTSHIETGTY